MSEERPERGVRYWECICGSKTKGKFLTDSKRCRCKDKVYEPAWYPMPEARGEIRRDRRIYYRDYGLMKNWTRQAKKDQVRKPKGVTP